MRSVRREEVEGNTWVIADWNPRSVYQIPVAPLEPTILLLPVGESLTSGIVGSSDDLSVQAGATGQRATVALMPNCAAPGSKRFGADAAKPLAPCMDRTLQAAIITDGGVYTVQLQVRDWRAMPVVEINHAPPGRSEDPAGRPPQPVGAREALLVKAKSEPPAPWMPTDVWADQEKLVIGFAEPPPTLPALFAGQAGRADGLLPGARSRPGTLARDQPPRHRGRAAARPGDRPHRQRRRRQGQGQGQGQEGE